MDDEADNILKSIDEDGFYYHEDGTVGKEVHVIAKFQPFSEPGLDFIAKRAIHDELVSKVLQSSLSKTTIAWCKYNSAKPKIIFSWMIPGALETKKILCLQWYDKDSEAKFWSGSHKKILQYQEKQDFGMPEVIEDSLKQPGITEKVISMPQGGFVIFDVRMAFQWRKGGAIDLGCGKREEFTWKRRWKKGMLEEQKRQIRDKIAAIETDSIKFLEEVEEEDENTQGDEI